MIKDFLIISFTGKNNSIVLRIDNNFFFKKLQTNIRNNELLVNNIFDFIKEKNANINKNFSVIVNIGPGSFSGIKLRSLWLKVLKYQKVQKFMDTKTPIYPNLTPKILNY